MEDKDNKDGRGDHLTALKRRAWRMYKEGTGTAQIASRVGRTPKTVRRWKTSDGWDKHPRPYDKGGNVKVAPRAPAGGIGGSLPGTAGDTHLTAPAQNLQNMAKENRKTQDLPAPANLANLTNSSETLAPPSPNNFLSNFAQAKNVEESLNNSVPSSPATSSQSPSGNGRAATYLATPEDFAIDPDEIINPLDVANKIEAGVHYQVAKAFELCQSYKLAIRSTNMKGDVKINTVPIRHDAIDWEQRSVLFDGDEYPLDCLIPDRSSQVAGLSHLENLTGTLALQNVNIKKRELEVQQGSVDVNKQTSISLSRPKRLSLAEHIAHAGTQ